MQFICYTLIYVKWFTGIQYLPVTPKISCQNMNSKFLLQTSNYPKNVFNASVCKSVLLLWYKHFVM